MNIEINPVAEQVPILQIGAEYVTYVNAHKFTYGGHQFAWNPSPKSIHFQVVLIKSGMGFNVSRATPKRGLKLTESKFRKKFAEFVTKLGDKFIEHIEESSDFTIPMRIERLQTQKMAKSLLMAVFQFELPMAQWTKDGQMSINAQTFAYLLETQHSEFDGDTNKIVPFLETTYDETVAHAAACLLL